MAKSSTRRVNIYINGQEVEATIKEVRKEMNRLVNEQNRMVIGSDEYIAHAKKIRELREVLNEHARQIGTVKSGWQEMYDKVMQFGTGVGGFVQIFQAIDSATDTLKQLATDLAALDDIYSDVMKTTGFTHEQVEELNESFKKMDTRTSREQLNNLAYIAGKLGINTEELVQQFVEAADVINVSMGDVLGDDATLAIGKMADVYKKTSDTLAEKDLKGQLLALGSAVNELGQSSTANEAYMVNFAGRLGGIAVQAKLSADEILGYASALDQDMQKVEMSATAFQKLIQKIISKPAEFAKIAGMEVQQFTELIENDMNSAIKSVLKGFQGSGGFDKLLPVFKDLGLDSARAAAAISSMANSLDKVETAQSIANKAMNEGVSCTNEFDTKNNNLQASLEKARKKFQDTRLELGQKLYPVLLKLTKTSTAGLKLLAKGIKYCTEHKAAVIAILTPLATYLANRVRLAAVQLISNTRTKLSIALLNAERAATLRVAAAKYKLAGDTAKATQATKLYHAAITKVPWVAIATAIIAIVSAMAAWVRKTIEIRNSTDFLKQHKEMMQDVQREYNEQSQVVRDLIAIIHNENYSNEERYKAIRKLKELMPDYNAQLTKEGRLINENSEAIDKYLKMMDLEIEATAIKSKLMEAQAEYDQWLAENKDKINKKEDRARQAFKDKIEGQQAEWYEVGKKIKGFWGGIVDAHYHSSGASGLDDLEREASRYSNNVSHWQREYDAKLEEIGQQGGSPTDVVTGDEDTEEQCTGDWKTCTCAACEAKRHQQQAAAEASKEQQREWAQFMERMAKLREEDLQLKMSDIEKEKAQIRAKFEEQIAIAQKFEKTKGRLARQAAQELAEMRDRAIEQADRKSRQQQMQKVEEDYQKLCDKVSELQDKLSGTMTDKYARELASVQKQWSEVLAEIDRNIAYYQSKQDEPYDPIAGTGLSEEEIALLQKLLEQKQNAITAQTAEELDVVKRAEQEVTEALMTEQQKRTATIRKEYEDKIAIAETAINKLKSLDAEANKDRIKQLEEQIEQLKKKMQEELDGILDEDGDKKSQSVGLARLFEIDWKHFRKDWEKNLSDIVDVIQDFANQAMALFNSISNLQKNNETRLLNQYKQNYDERKEKLDWQLEQGIISQEYYDAQVQKLDEELEKKEKEIELEQFRRQKRAAIAEAVISGIVSAVKSFENGGGFPWGLIPMALSLATTGVQIAAIASEPEPYAKGGYIEQQKHILAGENGREWIASHKLLQNPETAPVIEALEQYQQGNRSAWKALDFTQPDGAVLSQAANTISRNFAADNTPPSVANNYQSATDPETLSKMLEQLTALTAYMSDPKNRQAVISREMQLEFEQQENFLRNAAALK